MSLFGCGGRAATPAATPSAAAGPEKVAGLPKAEAVIPPPAGSGSGAGGAGGQGGRFAPADYDPKNPPVYQPGPGGRPAKLAFKRDLPASVARYPGYEEARMMHKNVAFASDSVARGAKLYKQSCVMCHGADGSGPEKLKFNLRPEPRDLAEPMQYRYGASDQAVWRSIMYGLPGTSMGGFAKSYSETQVWDIVNYLQSLEKPQI